MTREHGNGTEQHFFMVIPTRWERIKIRFTWGYIRQTRFLYPITMWWLNRG